MWIKILLLVVLVIATAVCEDRLLFVYSVVRHGAVLQNSSNEEKSELSNSGKRQMYLLGQELREKYIN